MIAAKTDATQPTPYLILSSHPIQYFAPLYRAMAEDSAFSVKVLYCSQHGLQGEVDRQFATSVQWDVPLLDGYQYEFISNQSPRPSIYTFWGLLNLSVLKHLWKAPKSIVWVHGWAYAVNWLTLVAAKLMGHTVCLRGESPYRLEQRHSARKQQFRQFILGDGLFRFVDYFLYIGQQNKRFYTHMGVPDEKLIFCPYAVDNARFRQEAAALATQRTAIRDRLNLPQSAVVVLYSGKYIAKKRPMDLLCAVHELADPKLTLVLMGDGELRPEMESFINDRAMTQARLTGFVNQSMIGAYYAAADIYVMCSTEEETWGLSTNEAMNFGLPLILSDRVGCSDDLLIDGQNGYCVTCGELKQLTEALRILVTMPITQRTNMGHQSTARIGYYSYGQIIASMKTIHTFN